MCNREFEPKQMYGIYMTLSEWAEVIEVLITYDKPIGEYIGDEIGILLSSNTADQQGCPECMHRDQCIIKSNKPICRQYLNVKVVKP